MKTAKTHDSIRHTPSSHGTEVISPYWQNEVRRRCKIADCYRFPRIVD